MGQKQYYIFIGTDIINNGIKHGKTSILTLNNGHLWGFMKSSYQGEFQRGL